MYKKDDYIAFMSKQPHVHLNEMFGHNNLTEDDFEKSEYKGIIKSVIKTVIKGNSINFYTVITLSPLKGFFCIVFEEDILRLVDVNEIEENSK